MRKWVFFLAVVAPLFLGGETPIVFVHLGRMLPSYYREAIAQAHLFNPHTPIYLIIHSRAAAQIHRKKLIPSYTNLVIAQTLPISDKHKRFAYLQNFLPGGGLQKFWRYSMERFFVLEEFLEKYGIEEVLHLEGDNLLYAELEKVLPLLRTKYTDIAVPFLNDDECVPGIVYIHNRNALGRLTTFINENMLGDGHRSDMTLMALFAHQEKRVESLPSVPPEYVATQSMVSLNGRRAADPNLYATNAALFHFLFDPAPIGQYLDGESFRQAERRTSLINENAVYNASLLPLMWEKDAQGRTIPCLMYDGEKWPLINLHIHSKNLYKFVEGE